MSQVEQSRRLILELIASDPDGDWNVRQICEYVHGHFDHLKGEVIRRALQNMTFPGTWRVGRHKGFLSLFDPCSDARLADLAERIAHLEKKGWHENAKARAQELNRVRALKEFTRD